jgi:hypothetical protein
MTWRCWSRTSTTRMTCGAGRTATAQSERIAMRVSTGLPGTSVQGSICAGRPPGSATREAPGPETRISVSVNDWAPALVTTSGIETTGSAATMLIAPASPAVAPNDTRTSSNGFVTGAARLESRTCIPAAPSKTAARRAAAHARRLPVEPPEIASSRSPPLAVIDQLMGSISWPGATTRRYAACPGKPSEPRNRTAHRWAWTIE